MKKSYLVVALIVILTNFVSISITSDVTAKQCEESRVHWVNKYQNSIDCFQKLYDNSLAIIASYSKTISEYRIYDINTNNSVNNEYWNSKSYELSNLSSKCGDIADEFCTKCDEKLDLNALKEY